MTLPGHDPMGPVVITTRDIYDALVRLTDTVGQLVNKGDGHSEDIRDHETRLRSLEDSQPARRITRLEEQVKALEASRWPVPALSMLIALAALLYTVLGPGK